MGNGVFDEKVFDLFQWVRTILKRRWTIPGNIAISFLFYVFTSIQVINNFVLLICKTFDRNCFLNVN